MSGFYRRALSKSLTEAQYRELLVSASGEIFRLKAVLDSLPSGILVCDERHLLVMANKSALRLLPLSQPEGNLLWELVLDEGLSGFFRRTLSAGDRVLDHEADVPVRSGNRLLSISVHPLVDRKQISGSLVHIEDITEKRARETRLRRAENLASLTTLAAGVAHEIKNPLGSISIHLQLMQKALDSGVTLAGGGDEASAAAALFDRCFAILNEEVDRLNRIVVDFLFAVRPMTLELREENLNAIISETAEFVASELKRSGIRLVLELDAELPQALLDERYVKNVILNLIRNSQEAMPDGGLLTISTEGGDGEIRLRVRDSGCGITAENIGKIFEPFFTTKDTGTGLGLIVVYKIVREHRGDIAVDSGEGEGTVFEITLPAFRKRQNLIAYRGEVERRAQP